MSMNPMHKLYEEHPPEVDWDAINKSSNATEAMDCLTPMGVTSENVSREYHLERRILDEFAVGSHQKAARAQALGKFKSEIIPIGNISQDDGIRPSTTIDKLAKLTPVFDKEKGSTTAGNSSQLTDGAAAVLLMSREEAIKRKLPILGVFRSYAVEGVPPKIMGIGPVYAIPSALEKASLSKDDVDVYEINEAFASQAYYSIQSLQLDPLKVNKNGGAIVSYIDVSNSTKRLVSDLFIVLLLVQALGHPLGCSGARMVVSLLHEMRREKNRWGVVSMCIGTGMGAAAVFEVENVRASL